MNKKNLSGIVLAAGIFFLTLYFLLSTIAPGKHQQRFYRFFLEYDGREEMRKYSELNRTPYSVIRDVAKTTDKVLFDKIYVANEHNMRVPIKQMKSAQNHSIFTGCSFAFGTGLEVPETLAAIYQEKKPGYQSYNIGFPGGGAQHVLRYFELFDLKAAVDEAKGEFYYIFITEHLDRFHLRFNSLAWMNPSNPHYEVSEGQLVYKGPIHEQKKAKFFNFMRSLHLANFLITLEGHRDYTDQEIDEFAVAIRGIKEKYLKLFPEGKFKFVVHPLGIRDEETIERILPALARNGIWVFNTKKYYNGKIDRKKFEIEGDSHPNALFNQQFAEQLAQ